MGNGQNSVWKPRTTNQLPALSHLIFHFITSFTLQLFNPEATGIAQPHGHFPFMSAAWDMQSMGKKKIT